MLKIYSILLLIVLFGCASESNQINISTLLLGAEKLYIGKININFNKLQKNEFNCVLFVNSEFRPTLKISSDGYVYYKSSAPNIDFGQIACQNNKNSLENTWYNFTLSFNLITAPDKSDTVTYFGDVNINWNTESDQVSSVSSAPERGNKIVTGRVNNAGKLDIKIQDNYSTATKDFIAKNPELAKSIKFRKSLLTLIK